jgi:hypothetical protein
MEMSKMKKSGVILLLLTIALVLVLAIANGTDWNFFLGKKVWIETNGGYIYHGLVTRVIDIEICQPINPGIKDCKTLYTMYLDGGSKRKIVRCEDIREIKIMR